MTDEGRKQDRDAAGAPGEETLAGEAGTTGGGEDEARGGGDAGAGQ